MLLMGDGCNLTQTIIPMEVQCRPGNLFLLNWGKVEPMDVVVSWLRLQAPADCIQHPI
jgi:hypothetical protein